MRRSDSLTAIDLSADMVAVARAHPGMNKVKFVVAAFEDFDAGPASYDLVVSATAFHWVDPDTGLAKGLDSCGRAAGWRGSPSGRFTTGRWGPR